MERLLIILTILVYSSCGKNENLNHEIIGKWKWTHLCGGITGACEYADENSTRILEITNEKMTEISNVNSVMTKTYTIISKTNYKGYTEYQIKFDNQPISIIKASKNTLEIESGSIWNGYKKL